MTLIVSLRVPDGVVIAGDSCSSILANLSIIADLKAKCPKCEEEFPLNVPFPTANFVSTTFSFTQKIFSFFRSAGVGAFGVGMVNNKSIYQHIKSAERKLENKKGEKAETIAQSIGEYFYDEFLKEDKDFKTNVKDACPMGFQYVTCEDGVAKTFEVFIKKEVELKKYEELGCTVNGDTVIVTTLWEIGRKQETTGPKINGFSLQDAIDYSEFLINTTAQFQRFSSITPSVSGAVDVAVITPFHDFTWIKLKPLTKLVEASTDKK